MNWNEVIRAIELESEEWLRKSQHLSQTAILLRERHGIMPKVTVGINLNTQSSVPNHAFNASNAHTTEDNSVRCVGDYSGYKASMTNIDKIYYIIKAENRFLHLKEITNIAMKVEGGNNIDIYKGKFSPTLSVKAKEPNSLITNFKVGASNNNTVWGYKEWLINPLDKASDENYKPEYKYDESALQYKPNR